MFSIIGIVVVIGAIVGGYLMEHGNLKVLIQPAELIIIGGAAIGTLLIANPLPVIIKLLKGVAGAFGSEKFSKDRYLDTLKMLNELFVRGRKGGISSLEQDVEAPDKSEVFKKRTSGGAHYRRRCPARPRYCRGRTGRGDHHGIPRRAAGGDRAQGRRGVGGNILRNSIVLWLLFPTRSEHGQSQRF